MNLKDRVLQTRAGFLYRHEARMAAQPRHMITVRVWALLCDVLGVICVSLALAPETGSAATATALALAVAVSLAPSVSAAGLMVAALAGEKRDGTLQVMMLTPVGRRELLWAKLLGRTAPARTMLLWSLPAFFSCALATAILLVGNAGGDDQVQAVFRTVAILLGSGVAAAAWAGFLVADVHCVAAMALYCSGRAGSPLTAQFWSLLLIFAPIPILGYCTCGVMGIGYHLIAAPIMFTELVRNLDAFALGDE